MTTEIAIDTMGAIAAEPSLELRAGVPYSHQHDDVYHHRDGNAERERIFLGLNALPQRFAALRAGMQFHIGELGFGSGLSAMLATRLFLRLASADCSLHFTSFEAAPLRPPDWQLLTPLRTEVAELHAYLTNHAPLPVRGWHRRWLHPRVRLSLFHGDAQDGLAELRVLGCGAVDAWFLDGFAPLRNAEMWNQAVCSGIAALSAARTTLASFTAAGHVRRALTQVGFDVERVDGHPFKRHALRAAWRGTEAGRPRLHTPPAVHVLGAGLAGSVLAHALVSRGGVVTYEDVATRPPGGASANPAAALHTRLPRRLDTQGRLRLAGFSAAAAWLDLLRPKGWHAGGVLHLGIGRDSAWLRAFAAQFPGLACAVDDADASSLAGLPNIRSGVYLPRAGHVDLAELSRSVLPDIAVRSDERPRDAVCIVTAPAVARVHGLHAVPGTVTMFRGVAPAIALSGAGYVLPMAANEFASGGTYDRAGSSNADARNIARAIAHGLPAPEAVVGRFQGVRYTTLDRLPLVGPSAIGDGTWLCTGFASAGLSWAWLAAEILVSELCGEPPAICPELRAALLPARAGLAVQAEL